MPAIDFAGRRPWLDARLDALAAAGARIRMVEVAGRPAGFVTVDPARSHVDQVAVDPSCQGRGLAAALIAEAKRLCPEGLALEVNRDNAPARRLYARLGFRVEAEGANPASGLPTLLLRWTPSQGAGATSA